MQTKQCVRLHSGTVVQMVYAIASAIKGTLNSWGQTESSYFRHLWQAGVEPRHLDGGELFGKLVPPAVGWPLALDLQVPVGAQISPSLQEMGFVHDVRGETMEGKAIKRYQTQRHQHLHCKVGQVSGTHGLPSSPNPPWASADGYCPTAGGRTAGWTDQLSVRDCTVWFLLTPWSREMSGGIPKRHRRPWRGQSARPAQSTQALYHFLFPVFLAASCLHIQQCSGLSKEEHMTMSLHLQLTLSAVNRVSWSTFSSNAASVLIKFIFPPGQVLHLFSCFPVTSHGNKASSLAMHG